MLSLLDFFLVSIVFLCLASIWWYAAMPANLPPGPRGLPFFGSMFDTWRAANLHNKLHDWTKLYGPVYRLYVADKLVLVLGDWNAIHEALVKRGDIFAGRPVLVATKNKNHIRRGLVNSEGDWWKTQRRFALSTLREFGVGKPVLEPRIKDECEHLVAEMQSFNGQPFNPALILNNAVSNVICALVFGRRFDYDDKSFHVLLRRVRERLTETDVSFLTPFVLSDTMSKVLTVLPKVRKFINASSAVDAFTKKQIDETMKNFDVDHDEPTNYIQAFYKAQREKEDKSTFTDQQLWSSVNDLFLAGTDTTATTLRWAVFFLAHNPQIQEEIYAELKREIGPGCLPGYADRSKMPHVEAAIMETQRMANLVPLGVLRRTLTDCKVSDYDIPADTVVVPLLTSALWDPKVYPKPNVFDPYRFLNGTREEGLAHLIPFQAGKRICLGESLARMELFLFYTALVSNFKFSFRPDYSPPPIGAERVSFIRAPPPYEICASKRNE